MFDILEQLLNFLVLAPDVTLNPSDLLDIFASFFI